MQYRFDKFHLDREQSTLPDPLAAVGRLIVSQDHNSLAEAIVDDIHVRWYRDEPPESDDRIFSDSFEGDPN